MCCNTLPHTNVLQQMCCNKCAATRYHTQICCNKCAATNVLQQMCCNTLPHTANGCGINVMQRFQRRWRDVTHLYICVAWLIRVCCRQKWYKCAATFSMAMLRRVGPWRAEAPKAFAWQWRPTGIGRNKPKASNIPRSSSLRRYHIL